MGRMPSYLVVSGLCLGRFAALLLLAWFAVPVKATTPTEPAAALSVPETFSIAPPIPQHESDLPRYRSERPAFPTEQPRVPVNDALRPPQLLWNPTPASLVKLVPAKVRYKLKF